jgi:hypothetical protein
LDADRTFHLALLRLNGNGELVEIVERLRDRSRLYGLKTLAESNELMSSAEEHLGILAAIFARDAAQAKSLMLQHLEHVGGDWANPFDTHRDLTPLGSQSGTAKFFSLRSTRGGRNADAVDCRDPSSAEQATQLSTGSM